MTEADRASRRSTRDFLLLCWLAASVAALLLYGGALHGPFVADDAGYVANNPYIQTLDFGHFLALWNPSGAAALYTANYAPVHMIACMLEWHFFGADTFGYHLVNVLAHALVATLIVAFFLSTGIPRLAAVVLGAIFLVHPANVEAVAWIFQLKTILALGLAVGALLLFRRRPLAATLLFALALLTKISAAFALPVLAAQLWVATAREPQGEGAERRGQPWGWLLAWLGVFAVCAWPEFSAFARYGSPEGLQHYPDLWAHLRSIVAVGGRYLWMAATSLGVSAFQDPKPSGLLDPWWLGGVVALALLGWRTVVTLRRRSPEAVYWVWAAASFAPVSQIFPFLFPVGDRYLYEILPGLLGGAFLLGRDALAHLRADRAATLRRAALVGSVALWGAFVVHASLRVPLWRSEVLLNVDAAQHYPHGRIAEYLNARDAVQQGNVDAALASLKHLADQGYDGFQSMQADPTLSALSGDPRYDAIVAQVAGNWIHNVAHRKRLLQPELLTLSVAHLARGERQQAIEACEAAVRQGGPFDAAARRQLAQLRQEPGG